MNAGPGIYSTANVTGVSVFGLIEDNDGPAWLVDEWSDGTSAQAKGIHIGGRLISNSKDPGSEVEDAESRNVATGLHVQNTARLSATIQDARVSGLVVSSYSDWNTQTTLISGEAGASDVAHLNSSSDRLVAINVQSIKSLTSGSNGSGYHYDETGGSAL